MLALHKIFKCNAQAKFGYCAYVQYIQYCIYIIYMYYLWNCRPLAIGALRQSWTQRGGPGNKRPLGRANMGQLKRTFTGKPHTWSNNPWFSCRFLLSSVWCRIARWQVDLEPSESAECAVRWFDVGAVPAIARGPCDWIWPQLSTKTLPQDFWTNLKRGFEAPKMGRIS